MQRYTHLKTLERKIIEAGKNINQHHKNFVKARTGSNTAAWNAPNKPGFTKQQYEAFVRKAIELQYNKYDPLIRRYKLASNKYRGELGLPTINLGPSWTSNMKGYTTVTKNGPNVVTYANLTRLVGSKSGIYHPGKSSGGHGKLVWISLNLSRKKFYPNVQLLNALLPARMNAAHRMAAARSRKSLAFRLSGMKHKRRLNMEAAKLALKYPRPLKNIPRARSASPRRSPYPYRRPMTPR